MSDDEKTEEKEPLAEEESTTTALSHEDALKAMMQEYFLEYASYVVKERAIPDVDDGLKPVQRRILHTLQLADNGMFHKVANVYGACMKYHPHGDASIYEALVVLANKEYFIDHQGNFGNIITGHPAAAGRYIECRLSKFAREVMFNPDITTYVPSYDGRNQEPVLLPAKVPALLMLGSDGVAVGMATHILPHNFCELIQAEISILKGESFQILPDFQTGGLMDASEYNDGQGKVLVRARIEADGDKRVVIKEVPAFTTTETLIASIEKAAKNGKIKINGIVDLTADTANIEITLARGVYAEETIQALYAYTDCQMSIKSNLLVICDGMPKEMTVSQVLHRNVEKLQEYLRRELELKLNGELEALQAKSLERIFIEYRIYKRIEKCETMEKVMKAVRSGLEEHREEFIRDVTDDDITRLLAIPIRRISLFDLNKNQEDIAAIQKEKAQTEYDLAHQVPYAIAFLERLLEKYGPAHPRRTEITNFKAIDRREIARRDIKVYHDRVGGFIGTSVKSSNKNEAPLVCTEFDRLMILRGDGTCMVIPISDRTYIGQARYVFIYNPAQIYSILYHDKKEGTWYAKRFAVGQYILSKEYHVIPENCLIDNLYTSNGVVLSLELSANRRRAYNAIKVEFASYPLRTREARGFKITHYPVVGVSVLERGGAAADGAEAENAPEGAGTSPEGAGTSPESQKAEKPIYPPKQEELPFFLNTEDPQS